MSFLKQHNLPLKGVVGMLDLMLDMHSRFRQRELVAVAQDVAILRTTLFKPGGSVGHRRLSPTSLWGSVQIDMGKASSYMHKNLTAPSAWYTYGIGWMSDRSDHSHPKKIFLVFQNLEPGISLNLAPAT